MPRATRRSPARPPSDPDTAPVFSPEEIRAAGRAHPAGCRRGRPRAAHPARSLAGGLRRPVRVLRRRHPPVREPPPHPDRPGPHPVAGDRPRTGCGHPRTRRRAVTSMEDAPVGAGQESIVLQTGLLGPLDRSGRHRRGGRTRRALAPRRALCHPRPRCGHPPRLPLRLARLPGLVRRDRPLSAAGRSRHARHVRGAPCR